MDVSLEELRERRVSSLLRRVARRSGLLEVELGVTCPGLVALPGRPRDIGPGRNPFTKDDFLSRLVVMVTLRDVENLQGLRWQAEHRKQEHRYVHHQPPAKSVIHVIKAQPQV